MIRRRDGTIDLVATYEFMFKAKPSDAAIAYLHQIEEIAQASVRSRQAASIAIVTARKLFGGV